MPPVLPPMLAGEDVVTDARLPERWLNDYRIGELSDAGHRLFVNGLLWAVSNRTDGHIPDKRLHRIRDVNHGHAPELVESGLWRRESDGYLIVEFAATQTSAAQLAGLEAKKADTKDRVARHRESRRVTRYTKDRTETGHGQEGQAVREGSSRTVPSQRPRPLPQDGWD